MTRASETTIAQRQFAINAGRERVSALLAKAIYQSLPMEKMDIPDDKTFRADLKWRVAFVPVVLRLEGKFTDLSLPESLVCHLSVKRAIMRLGVKVIITLKALDGHRTEIVCRAVTGAGDSGGVLGRVLRGRQKAFARDTFESVRARLEQLCS